MKLRSFVIAAMGALGLIALTSALSLVAITGLLHRSSIILGDAVESVRLAEELEVDLLAHDRSQDRIARTSLDADIRGKVLDLRMFVTSDEERTLLDETDHELSRYLGAASKAGISSTELPELAPAFAALEKLVRLNVREARESRNAAGRWDHIARTAGLTIAIVLVLGVGSAFAFLELAFRPVLRLGEAMERFGKGDTSTRSPERGPAEFREMSRRFNELAAALARQRESQLSFLAGIAHDLRNPLASLRISAGIVAPDHPLPSEEKIRRAFRLFDRQIDRFDRIVGDFLDTARIEAGRLELRLQRHDLRATAAAVMELFEPLSGSHDLVLMTPPEPVHVICDPLRIEQVANNLVSNAMKYSPKGGRIEVTVESNGGGGVFSVRDQGIGISDQDQRQLFEPFRRLGSAHDTPGMGLGLSVSRRIAVAHGGSIDVLSDVGAGSTFRLRLPLAHGATLVPEASDVRTL